MAKQNKGKQAGNKKAQANKSMQTSQVKSNLTPKGMIKDVDALYLGDKNWSHAINAINNSVDGDTGVIGNEPANLHCANTPYRIIGGVHLYGDKWILFSTDNFSSEIGSFDDSKCEYTTVVNDVCLNFNQDNLIIGAAKENFDCSWQIYWDDGMNPSRTLNLDNIPWIQIQTEGPTVNGAPCAIFEDTTILDCEKIRLAPWVDIPCIELSKAPEGGQLRNGSYQVYLAYLVNDMQIGDYVGISNIQPIWSHENTSGSINIELSNLDTEFEYYKLAIAFAHEGSVVAKKLGVYTTQQTTINVDYINPSLADITIADLPRRGEAYEKSEGMYVVNDYLIRSNPVEQFDFNYQPIANNIVAKWVSTKYPSDYYRDGGNKPTFLRDEQYAFFIRFIYNTGERSSSYHIPGRPPGIHNGNQEDGELGSDINDLTLNGEKYFEAYNTATSVPDDTIGTLTDDGGVIIGVGHMGYWESTEVYPALDPVRWNTNDNVQNGTVSLCGEPIRHHKMPDESLPTGECALSSVSGQYIHILGVKFENISPPLDNDGNVITNIQGFEILTGSRVGNKSIIAKGLIRNMMEYESVDGNGEVDTDGTVKNYMANYPYNSKQEDPYLIKPDTGNTVTGSMPFLSDITPTDNWLAGQWTGLSDLGDVKTYHHVADSRSLNTFSNEMFTFHSPETQFERVYLNARELRVYGNTSGIATGHFTKSEDHPQHKILKDWMAIVAIIAGVGYAIYQMRGKKKRKVEGMQSNVTGEYGIMAVGSGTWAAPFPGAGTLTAAANSLPSFGATALDFAGDYLLESAVNLGSIVGAGNLARALRLTLFKTQELGAAALSAGHIGPKATVSYEGGKFAETPDLMGVLTGLTTFMTHTATGGQELVDLLLNLMSYQDYTWKYNSHGFFNNTQRITNERHRFDIHKNMYIGSNLQNMDSNIRINNMHRPGMVVLNTDEVTLRSNIVDNSKFIIGDLRSDTGGVCSWYTPGVPVRSSISALYAGLKFNIDNQYGQLDSIKQMPLRGCSFMFKDQQRKDPDSSAIYPLAASDIFVTTKPLFGGDNYINRYTEKTVMPFWWNFMKGEPDGTPFDYRRYTNIPFPRYWMNTEKFRLDEMTKIFTDLFSFASNMNDILPSGMYHLDQAVGGLSATDGLTGVAYGESSGGVGGQGSSGPGVDTDGGDVACNCTGTGTVTVPDTTDTTASPWTWSGSCNMEVEVTLDDGSTATVSALVQASGGCNFGNTVNALGGHAGATLAQYNAWPNHGTGNGIDLNRAYVGTSGNTYDAPGAITISGTYNHSTNQITVIATGVSFVSDTVYATHNIVTTDSNGIATSADYNWNVPAGFFDTADCSTGSNDYAFSCPPVSAGAPTPELSGEINQSLEATEAGSKFAVRDAFMYTHNNGVLDFFVESELNLAFRDRGEENDKRFYDKFDFTDVNALFHADIIQAGNYYKYNKQLSNKYFQAQISASWGEIQPRYYDPLVAASCWVDYPKRLIYSLQASQEKRKDNWRVFLPNNFKDFKDRITTIKELSQSSALMLFPTLSPRMFNATDTIQTNNTKFTIGDGGLFNKEPQNIANSDLSHEYGSCESNRSVATTPQGVFFVSQAQGKIFNYAGKGLDPISNQGMKWWFNKYLPSTLLAQFPGIEDCPIGDNPLTGIGCQSVYDPNNDLVYFSKKDYSVLPEMSDCILYNACEGFAYNLTACDGIAASYGCPPGYFYNEETDLCEKYQLEAATIEDAACEADIVIVVDSSNSIKGNGNVGPMIQFVTDIVTGLQANSEAEEIRIGIAHFGAGRNTTANLSSYDSGSTLYDTMFNPGEQIALTSNGGTITDWMAEYSVYWHATNDTDTPAGTDIVGGVWAGMNLLYGANSRPDVAKRLIIVGDGFHGTQTVDYVDGVSGTASINAGNYLSANDIHPAATAGGATVSPVTPDVTIGSLYDSVSSGTCTDSAFDNNPTGCTNAGETYTYVATDIYVATSDATDWVQDNIINNTNVYGTQQTYFIGLDARQPNNQVTTPNVTNQQPYFNLFANSGNSYYGSLEETANISQIVEDLIENVCPPAVYQCLSTGCEESTTVGFCNCLVTTPTIPVDQTKPVELTDTDYFEDASWTVSYDPKSKAWVSFHDWHPELSFNSINHFMTTKGVFSDKITCPADHTYNAETELCCKNVILEEPAQITDIIVSANVELTDATVTASPDDMDVAILISATERFIDINSGAEMIAAQANFVEELIGNDGSDGNPVTNLAIGMAAGNVQVGIAEWEGKHQTNAYTNHWHSLQALTNDVALCNAGVAGMTPTVNAGDFDAAVLAGNNILTGSTAPRKIAIVITSPKGVGLCSAGAIQENFDAGIEVIVVHLKSYNASLQGCNVGGWEDASDCVINDASTDTAVCNENHFEITSALNSQNTTGTINDILEGLSSYTCSCAAGTTPLATTNPCLPAPNNPPQCMECSCPTGYTIDPNASCNYFDPPQCVLQSCECDPPVLGAELTETGTCLDLSDPLMCTWDYETCVPPLAGSGSIWKHNVRTDLFSNYYGEDFPWEVDLLQASGQLVNTVRSIEYNLEAYVYKNGGRDRFHLLEFNFDQAELYNTEQTSGLLNLVLSPKNDVPGIMMYPIINANDIDILYSKEEQKYRFNQFWDVTNDRGEFSTVQEPIYITQLNGYIRDLNMENINLNKEEFQRKKFRHYYNHVVLRRAVSGDAKMLLRLANTKINLSPR